MGHYAYCSKCDAPMDMPAIADAIAHEQRCPACGAPRPLDAWDVRYAMETYVENIEARLAALEKKT